MKAIKGSNSRVCFLGIVLATAILSGCSQKSVNENSPPSISLSMKVSSPALMEAVSRFSLFVTAPDMDTVRTELTLNGRYLEGRVEVPAGRERKFDVRAYDEAGTLIYQGDTTVNVEPGVEIRLTIDLHPNPEVPLVRLSPRFQRIDANSSCLVVIKVFNIDSLYNISFRVYFSRTSLQPDSAVKNSTLDTGVEFVPFLIDSIPLTSYYAIAITQTDQTTPIVDDSGYATLGSIYFTSLYPEVAVDTAELTMQVTGLFKPSRDSIPVASVYTDNGLIEIQQGINPVVAFPDSALDFAIRDKLSKYEGDIFLSDVLTIDTLFADIVGISDLTGLSNLTNLEFLNLEMNQISDISELSDLTGLKLLFLDSNQISDISPLSGLTNLQWLDLSYNQISDINPLVLNTGLGAGDVVWLTGNPLDPTSINTHIPTLEGRGVTVNYDTGGY